MAMERTGAGMFREEDGSSEDHPVLSSIVHMEKTETQRGEVSFSKVLWQTGGRNHVGRHSSRGLSCAWLGVSSTGNTPSLPP